MVVKVAVRKFTNGKEVIMLLEECIELFHIRQRLAEEVAKAASAKAIALLLEQRGDEVRITEEAVKAAAENWAGKEVIGG